VPPGEFFKGGLVDALASVRMLVEKGLLLTGGTGRKVSNVSGNIALHVLVASGSDGACDQEPCDTADENVVVTETRVRILLQTATGLERRG